ncbi:MAG TPA: serine hydrolase domain-containing protein, partial [Rhodanobacteraceae bacterium]|nr:serine hydrolase domain-containing protein [Rhodanobacteraceae bacterium]
GDTPEQIRKWVPTVLSGAIDPAGKVDFAKALAAAVRDSGGLELVDTRPGPGPGGLVVTVKARRNAKLGVFVLAHDPAQPDKLAQAELVPVDDPALYAAWPKNDVPRAELTRLVRSALDRLVRTSDFSGCLTVSDGASTIFDECRGLAERSFGVEADRETRFHIGSMDKMFTAVAIAQLVEAGKLSWDSDLAKLVPEYPDRDAARSITVWQLLHHTAGLGDFFVPEFFEHREKFVDPADYLDLIARQPKAGEPGKEWNYSNAGYVLLGRIIENVSGESYFDYIQRHVFAAAGMSSSGFDSQEDITPALAVGYFHEGPFSTQWKANWLTLPFKGSPAGGGYSTNTDLIRFAGALREGKLMQPKTLAKLFDDEVPAGPGAYAAGFGDRLSHGRHIRGHAGGAPGMSADLAIVWETKAAVAITSNEGDSSTAMLLAERIADLLAAERAH